MVTAQSTGSEIRPEDWQTLQMIEDSGPEGRDYMRALSKVLEAHVALAKAEQELERKRGVFEATTALLLG